MSSDDMTQTRMAGSRFPMSSISRWSSTLYSRTQPETLVPSIKLLSFYWSSASGTIHHLTEVLRDWRFGLQIDDFFFFFFACLSVFIFLFVKHTKKIFHIKELCIINCIVNVMITFRCMPSDKFHCQSMN